MAVVCTRCGRQYDVTLFQFGRTVRCECGEILRGESRISVNRPQAEAEAAGVGYLTPATEQDLFLYVIRHGATVWNRSGKLQGQLDIELSDEGRAQARKVAGALAAVTFEAAWTSDLSRCVETARTVLAGRHVPLTKTPALREEDYGEWAGKTYAEIARRWPDQCRARERDRVGARPQGGEMLGELEQRVLPAMAKIAETCRRGNVLVVTHGGPAFVFFSRAMAPHGKLGGNVTVANCAINIVARTPHGWKIQLLNDTSHLG
ncbi:MAG: histidine phosphatase family protein [bacterium]